MAELNGPFKNIIPNFIKYKQSLGHKYNNINNYYKIDKILYKNNIIDFKNTKKIYNILITEESNIKIKRKNYYALKQLYEYMKIVGYTNLYFKEIKIEKKSFFNPYIFTKKEINELFKMIDKYEYKLPNNEKNIYPVLFRLIYSCGLRVNEAINLKTTDYNVENKSITVSLSKNNVTRIIPLSKTMIQVINKYLRIFSNNKVYFFEMNKSKLNYCIVLNYFKNIVRKCNINNYCRIHDLRHTFAVTTFNNMYKKNYSEEQILYYLHIYMGHTEISSTEKYIHFTNESYDRVVKKFEYKYKDLIPKVGDKK